MVQKKFWWSYPEGTIIILGSKGLIYLQHPTPLIFPWLLIDNYDLLKYIRTFILKNIITQTLLTINTTPVITINFRIIVNHYHVQSTKRIPLRKSQTHSPSPSYHPTNLNSSNSPNTNISPLICRDLTNHTKVSPLLITSPTTSSNHHQRIRLAA